MKLHHIGLLVKDCQRSADFYQCAFGLKITTQWETEEMRVINITDGNVDLELLQYKHDPTPIGTELECHNHIAFQVNSIDEYIKHLDRMGFSYDEPRETLTGTRILFFRGLDGERIELIEEFRID
ncbi:VOC family protein [Syntrophomonas erecta]